jgi:hypothetical protein
LFIKEIKFSFGYDENFYRCRKMMKARNIKILSIFLVLLCCFMGAVSAADDVSMDAVDASVDDAVTVDEVS